mgnify:CR=1 FL=1
MRYATVQYTPRKSQSWFDKTCYEMNKATLSTAQGKDNKRPRRTGHICREEEDLQTAHQRKKSCIYMEKKAKKMADEAKSNSHLILKDRCRQQANDIPIATWERHFKEILNQQGKDNAFGISMTAENSITLQLAPEEVGEVIWKTKNKKAPSPDRICMEHIKASQTMLFPLWTDIFNRCLHTGTIPEEWRKSMIKLLYKRKGEVGNPNSYRGFALENSIFKIFTKLLTEKLGKETENSILECQFGFR